MRRDCPQRQGSQGFGTPHSQSSVGPERTQFVPTMGQEKRYQAPMLHKHHRFHRQARKAKLWVEVEDRAHNSGFRGLRGVSTPLPND